MVRLLFALALFASTAALSDDQEKEKARIELLIHSVETSGCIFIRNGTKHSASEAAEHLRTKVKNALKTFFGFGPPRKITVDNFINKIASESSVTGEPYQIQCGDQTVKSKTWLEAKNSELSSHDRPPVGSNHTK